MILVLAGVGLFIFGLLSYIPGLGWPRDARIQSSAAAVLIIAGALLYRSRS
jgi:hypothetical protein